MNIYYNPAKFGLQTVGEIEWSNGNYQFDLTVVWTDGNGNFLYGEDSGCSCPSPFEDEGVDDLTKIESLSAFQEYLNNHEIRCGESRAIEIANLVEKLHAAGLR